MYEDTFNLHGRPFLPTPRVDRYFPAHSIENARLTLVRCIERGEGTGLIIGPAGTGKTLLCQVLARQFEDSFDIARLASGRLGTRTALLQAILYDLGQPYRGLDEGELRLALFDLLEPHEDGNAGLLLLVDEAHTLPLRLLEEIRMITNLVRDGQPRVRVVLAGSSLLEERFASPKLSAFAQRLAARCYLDALDAKETAAYVQSQLAAVGGEASRLIDEDALRSVHRATDGIPRLINQVCDHALLLASLGGASRLSSEAIEEAWADLQQLPAPWNDGPRDAAAGVVEFGQLSDTVDELPEAIPFHNSQEQSLHLAQTDDASIDSEGGANDEDPRCEFAGFGRTEADLDFPEFGDPMAEVFAEEEVVLDQYASDADTFADVPRVSSWEGRQLASMLWPVDPPPPRSVPAEPAALGPGAAALEPQSETHSADVDYRPVVEFSASVQLPTESMAIDEEVGTAHGDPPASDAGQATFWADAKAGDGDREMIVVEDETAPAAPPRPRKREYRQLFSKLRRR